MLGLAARGRNPMLANGGWRDGAPAPQGLPPLEKVKLMPIDLKKALDDQKAHSPHIPLKHRSFANALLSASCLFGTTSSTP
jgi:hypothetical protein